MNFSNSPLIPPLSPSLRGRAVPAGRRIARLFTFAFRVTCRVGTRLPGCPQMNLPAYVSGGGRGVTCPLSDGRLCSQQYPFAEALKRTPNFFRPSGMMSKYITSPAALARQIWPSAAQRWVAHSRLLVCLSFSGGPPARRCSLLALRPACPYPLRSIKCSHSVAFLGI